jgi:hypothetical protein
VLHPGGTLKLRNVPNWRSGESTDHALSYSSRSFMRMYPASHCAGFFGRLSRAEAEQTRSFESAEVAMRFLVLGG